MKSALIVKGGKRVIILDRCRAMSPAIPIVTSIGVTNRYFIANTCFPRTLLLLILLAVSSFSVFVVSDDTGVIRFSVNDDSSMTHA